MGKPYSLVPERWLDRQPTGQESKCIDVLKLHGSIDWYDRHYYDARRRWYRESGIPVPDRDPIFGPNPSVRSQPLVDQPLVRRIDPEADIPLLSRVFRVSDLKKHFPLEDGSYTCVVPFILPPAYDKLLGYELVVDLWDSLHHTRDVFSSITIIGYSMPQYDSYAYEALGRLLFDYQEHSEVTYWRQRRVPVQLITKAKSKRERTEDHTVLEAGQNVFGTKDSRHVPLSGWIGETTQIKGPKAASALHLSNHPSVAISKKERRRYTAGRLSSAHVLASSPSSTRTGASCVSGIL